jgi:hypothetical protein
MGKREEENLWKDALKPCFTLPSRNFHGYRLKLVHFTAIKEYLLQCSSTIGSYVWIRKPN